MKEVAYNAMHSEMIVRKLILLWLFLTDIVTAKWLLISENDIFCIIVLI